MALKPVESYPAGGVDSRSNPIVEPADRCLMVHDFWPQQDGSYRLRDGYVLQVAGLQANVPIHSVISVTGPAPALLPLVIFWQNKTPYVLNQSTNTVSTPTIKGAAIATSSRFTYFYANGHLHAFNGTDAKWFDGTYWRDIGLPTLTAGQVAAITVAIDGAIGLTPAQAAAITLTFGSGGSWPQNDVTGEYVYAAILSQSGSGLPILSPWVQLGGGYRLMGLAGQQLAVGGTPTLPQRRFSGLWNYFRWRLNPNSLRVDRERILSNRAAWTRLHDLERKSSHRGFDRTRNCDDRCHCRNLCERLDQRELWPCRRDSRGRESLLLC